MMRKQAIQTMGWMMIKDGEVDKTVPRPAVGWH